MLRIYDDGLRVLRMLRPIVSEIGRHDSDLARQLRRCSASMVLNTAEGSYARGGNRKVLFGVALGSTKETRACLDIAEALGYLDAIDDEIAACLEKIGGALYRLTHD